ncbi:MAG: T9SS type A sorting domain-containing protein [Chitinophagaceae bacterium]|nr:T9SS type A sorting domain-containing protein [Chitinophagaceae bacterium]
MLKVKLLLLLAFASSLLNAQTLNIEKVTTGGCYYSSGSKCIVTVQVSWSGLVCGNTISVTLGASTKLISAQCTPGFTPIVSPQTLAFEIPANGVSGSVTATVNTGSGTINTTGLYTAAAGCDPLVCTPGSLFGTVYYDYNINGLKDVTETAGQQGVDVTVFDVNGATYSATTNYLGQWKLSIPSANYPVRVEYSNIPSSLRSSASIAGKTTVQFYNSSTCNADLGVLYTEDYSQADPDIYMATWFNGDPAHASLANNLALHKTQYSKSTGANVLPGGPSSDVGPGVIPYSTAGALWGLAWDKKRKVMYTSAVVRRHTGLGTMGLAGLYKYDPVSNTTSGMDLSSIGLNFGTLGSNASRGLAGPLSPNYDVEGFSKVGKCGIGDIDISEDGETLYLVNLFDRSLVSLKVDADNNSATNPVAADASTFAIPDPGCNNGSFRPFGLKVSKGLVYIGVVCDASVSQNKSDLTATIYAFNPSTTTFTSVMEFPLTYPKGVAIGATPSGWMPWTDNYNTQITLGSTPGAGATYIGYPTPMMSDIEFDIDGRMILSIADRASWQWGWWNYSPNTSSNALYSGFSGGDVLRAHYANGVYTLENNAKSGPYSGAYPGNNQGPGFGEFYQDGIYHPDDGIGSLAVKPGSGEIVAGAMDPNWTCSGGYRFYNSTTGAALRNVNVFGNGCASFVTETFGKAAGLGDIELAVDQPNFSQIGNRVWADLDGDGIQDPNEPGIAGVQLCLYNAAGTNIATTNTDANGNYYFGNGVSGVNLTPGATYYVVAGCSQYNANGLQVGANRFGILTHDNLGEGSFPDNNDNDGTIAGSGGVEANFTGLPFAMIIAPDANTTNHTTDFGFTIAYLGNYVWLDNNLDGIQNEPTSNGINGVTVQLYKDDGLGNFSLEGTTTTANAPNGNPGYYAFQIYVPGNYKVKFPTLYTTYNLTGFDQTLNTDGNSDGDITTGYSEVVAMDPLGTGFDRINYTLDAGYSECTVTAPVMTGNQLICITEDPVSFSVTTPATGSGTLSYQWQSSTVSCSSGFTDIAGANSATYDPGFQTITTYYHVVVTNTTSGNYTCTATSNCLEVIVKPHGTIGNYLWNDVNHNGLQDETALEGINGVTVELYAETAPSSNVYVLDQTTTTASNAGNPGYYEFTICNSGNYKVKFPLTVGDWELTTQNPSSTTDGNSDADLTDGYSSVVTIDVNGTGTAKDNLTIDAGYHLPEPELTPYPNKQFCLGTNIQLVAYGAPGATFNWTTPAGFTGTIDNSVSGQSTITIKDMTIQNNGTYTVTQTKGINTSLPKSMVVDAGVHAKYEYVATTCLGTTGQVTIDVTPNTNMEYAINDGPYQNSNVFIVDPGKTFVASVRPIGSSCSSYYTGICVYCPGNPTCTAPPKDSLIAPESTCVNAPIAIDNYFFNASSVTFSSDGTGTFDVSNCNSSPCTIHYTASAADVDRGNVIIMATTDDPDGTGPCVASTSRKNIRLINGLVAPTITTNDPVCENSPLIMSQNSLVGNVSWLGASGYTSSQSTDTLTNTPATMNGLLQVTLNETGCSSVSSTKNVNVLTAPNLTATVTPHHELCAGQANGAIEVSVSGGSGNYQICYNSNLSNCVNGSNAYFQYIPAGNYTVTVVDLTCPNNIFSYPVTLNLGSTVNEPIVPASVNVCAGENLILSGTSTGTINWTFSGNTFNALGNTVIRYNAQTWMSGVYTAKTFDANGCASLGVPVQVTVGAVPVINHVQVNCLGNSSHIDITATSSDPMSYSFDGSIFQSSNIFDGLSGGNYTLSVKNTVTNCVTTLPVHIPNCTCPNEPVITITHPMNSCGLTPIPISATFTNVSAATWSTSGNGTFDIVSGSSVLNNAYTPSASDLSSGGVDLTLTTDDPDGAGPCTAVSEMIHINLVNALPIPSITGNQASYCTGDTVILSANVTLPVHWTGTGGFVSDSDVAYIPITTQFVSGPYTATITGNGCATTSDTYNLTVAPAPNLVVTTNVVNESCADHGNGEITVTVTGGSGTYKICNDFELNCSVTASPYTFKYLAPDTYQIHVSDATCMNARNVTPATVNPGLQVPPPLSASYNTLLCEGDDLVLTATGNNALPFEWTDMKNSFVQQGATITRTNAQAGMSGKYKVVQLDNGCASKPLELDVVVYDIPEITAIDTACFGGDSGRIVITANIAPGQQMEYALNDGSYQTSNVFEYLPNGLYQVRARAFGSQDCAAIVTGVEVYCSCNCNKEAVVGVYPSPNTGSFVVNADLPVESEYIKFELYDFAGRKIYHEELAEKTHLLNHKIDVPHLAAGNYMLKVTVDLDSFIVPVSITEK